MLTDRPDFRAWLARYEADHIRMGGGDKDRTSCDGCGAEGEPHSKPCGYCLLCLAERFGGDQVEEQMLKTLLGGMVMTALESEEIAADDLVVKTVQDAIREHAHASGASWARPKREAVV